MGRNKINREKPTVEPGKEDNVEIVENIVPAEKPKVEKQVLKPVIKGSVFDPEKVQEIFSVETVTRAIMTFPARDRDEAVEMVKNHFDTITFETTNAGDVHPLLRSVRSCGFRMLDE